MCISFIKSQSPWPLLDIFQLCCPYCGLVWFIIIYFKMYFIFIFTMFRHCSKWTVNITGGTTLLHIVYTNNAIVSATSLDSVLNETIYTFSLIEVFLDVRNSGDLGVEGGLSIASLIRWSSHLNIVINKVEIGFTTNQFFLWHLPYTKPCDTSHIR